MFGQGEDQNVAAMADELGKLMAVGAAQAISMIKALADDPEYANSIATLSRNIYVALTEKEFAGEQAFELTVALVKNATNPIDILPTNKFGGF